LPTFTGPYITHKPEVKVFDLNKKDRYLIMASDGLWDELSQQDIATIVQKNYGDKLRITQAYLFYTDCSTPP
jgi:pyruvate dehydrogenase phosphatase